MAKVYTRTGDQGETSLYSGERVPKCCPRIDAYGTVDELQASLGLARAFVSHESVGEVLYELQRSLVHAMAEMATLGGEARIRAEEVEGLEQTIDKFSALIPSGFSFQVPGESAGSAALHVARTVARRCERVILASIDEGLATSATLAFFNRISDLCYVLARYEDEAKEEER